MSTHLTPSDMEWLTRWATLFPRATWHAEASVSAATPSFKTVPMGSAECETVRRVLDELEHLRAEVAALKAERDALVPKKCDAFKEASGLEVGGDPDGVKPEHVARNVERFERELREARASAIEEAAKVADAEARNADETLRTFAWGTIGFYRHANRKAVAKELAASIRALAAK